MAIAFSVTFNSLSLSSLAAWAVVVICAYTSTTCCLNWVIHPSDVQLKVSEKESKSTLNYFFLQWVDWQHWDLIFSNTAQPCGRTDCFEFWESETFCNSLWVIHHLRSVLSTLSWTWTCESYTLPSSTMTGSVDSRRLGPWAVTEICRRRQIEQFGYWVLSAQWN